MTKRRRDTKHPEASAQREERAYVELLNTTDRLTRGVVAVLKAEELSPTQYNVLRVLRAAADGLPCGEIGRRLITREPDVTRLLDRMEERGLVSRSREDRDRRTVVARITRHGLEKVNRLDGPVHGVHGKQLGHLGPERLALLLDLLRAAREKV